MKTVFWAKIFTVIFLSNKLHYPWDDQYSQHVQNTCCIIFRYALGAYSVYCMSYCGVVVLLYLCDGVCVRSNSSARESSLPRDQGVDV